MFRAAGEALSTTPPSLPSPTRQGATARAACRTRASPASVPHAAGRPGAHPRRSGSLGGAEARRESRPRPRGPHRPHGEDCRDDDGGHRGSGGPHRGRSPHHVARSGPSRPLRGPLPVRPGGERVERQPDVILPPAAPVAHGGVDANRAGPAGIVPLAPWSPPPSSAPPAVAPTPTPSAGQLALSSVTADLSSGQQVTITLYALGGDVTWHAWCGGQDVTLSAGSGTAAPGVPSLLVFSAAPAQDGAVVARCHVWPGGDR